MNDSVKNLCLFNIAEGLNVGLSHFSGTSRAALIYAEKPDSPIRIYDPQGLLIGHEPKLKEIYLDSDDWRGKIHKPAKPQEDTKLTGQVLPEKNLDLTGLISCGGRADSLFYQMWFTEHHPDMCSIGPTERWLEHAAFLLAHDFIFEDTMHTATSNYVLKEYATHAVRDFVLDELNVMLGWDVKVAVYPILDAVLSISKIPEEGSWPRGNLAFISPADVDSVDFLVKFPADERPDIKDFKHVRKLLLSVQGSFNWLVSDVKSIVGVARGILPECRVTADFRGRSGFLRLAGKPVCSFSDGIFQSTNHKPNLVLLEEALIESELDTEFENILFKNILELVEYAGKHKHGCSVVIDLNESPISLSGQQLERPIDIKEKHYLEFAKSVSRVDGALHLGKDSHLHAFGCLLDGKTVPGEDRARGARYNSALRFTASQENVLVVAVSSDQPVSVFQGGVALTALCEWKSFSKLIGPPPKLEDWIESA